MQFARRDSDVFSFMYFGVTLNRKHLARRSTRARMDDEIGAICFVGEVFKMYTVQLILLRFFASYVPFVRSKAQSPRLTQGATKKKPKNV